MKIKEDEISIKGWLMGINRLIYSVVGFCMVSFFSIIAYNWDNLQKKVDYTVKNIEIIAINSKFNKDYSKQNRKYIIENKKKLDLHEIELNKHDKRIFVIEHELKIK